MIAEADFSPLYGGPGSSFGGVVGWFHPFVFQKGEQAIPMLEQALGRLPHIVVGTLDVLLEALVHSGSNGDRFLDKGLPLQMTPLERMPEREHSACLGEHPFGELHCVRASAGVLDSFDPSDDVGPAELSDATVKRLVGTVHVRTENPRVLIAQDLFEDL